MIPLCFIEIQSVVYDKVVVDGQTEADLQSVSNLTSTSVNDACRSQYKQAHTLWGEKNKEVLTHYSSSIVPSSLGISHVLAFLF